MSETPPACQNMAMGVNPSLIKKSSEQQLGGSNRAGCNTRFSLPRNINEEKKEPVTVNESGWKENWLIFGVN